VQTALEIESSVDVPSVSDPFISAPVMCGDDGAIFVRTATASAASDLISISRDGSTTTSFNASKMSDMVNPSATTFFVRGTDVYLLVRGSAGESETLALRRPDGSLETQLSSPTRQFVAHFKKDGTYIGATALDIPFRPLQVGAFPNGDFLIAGTTKDLQETRVALVKGNGQFNRFVELADDIRLQSGPLAKGEDAEAHGSATSLPQTGKRFGEGFFDATQISVIVADGPHLLVVRKGQRVPVFSVSPSGQVEAVRLDTPEGYSLWDIKTTRDFWVALFTHRLQEGKGVEFSSMAIDRRTGKTLKQYYYSHFPGFGLACTDGSEFTFLIRDATQLKIVRLTSSNRPSSPADQ